MGGGSSEVEELKRKLKAQIAQCKGSITRAESFLKKQEQKPDKEALMTRIQQIEAIQTNAASFVLQISLLEDTCSEDDFTEDDLEERCLSVLSGMRRLANQFQASTIKDCSSKSGMKLPEVEVPIFDGKDVTKYHSFIEIFYAIIGNNLKLSSVEKLFYLRKYLKGEPLSLIESLPLLECSYTKALELLKTRYDNKFLIITNHTHELTNFQPIVKGTASSLRELVSHARQHLGALKSLGQPIEHWDMIVLPILLRKIDQFSCRAFHSDRDNTKLPTLEEFFSFIEKRASSFEESQHSEVHPMLSASFPGEALAQQLGLSHLYPPPAPAMTPEFLPPPPRPVARYPPRRRDNVPAPAPYPNLPYAPFLSHGGYPGYLPPTAYRSRTQPTFPIRPRVVSSGFVPPAPAPHSPPVAPAPTSSSREEPPPSPERATPAPYFCRGALIRLEDGSLKRVEEMRTEDFVMSAERNGDLALTQCTLLRMDERGDRLSLTLTYDRNRSQVELESTVEHPFFVYGRGWASCKPERTLVRYGLQVQRLQVGDVCVSLVAKRQLGSNPQAPMPAPPQTQPENLSVKELKRRWSASDLTEEPPLKKR